MESLIQTWPPYYRRDSRVREFARVQKSTEQIGKDNMMGILTKFGKNV